MVKGAAQSGIRKEDHQQETMNLCNVRKMAVCFYSKVIMYYTFEVQHEKMVSTYTIPGTPVI